MNLRRNAARISRYFSRHRMIRVLSLGTVVIGVVAAAFVYLSSNAQVLNSVSAEEKKKLSLITDEPSVLGAQSRRTNVMMNGTDEGYAYGGVVALSSTDDPVLVLDAYEISGTADVNVYQATVEDVLTYLLHTDEAEMKNPEPDTQYMDRISVFQEDVDEGQNIINMPLEGTGVWYATIELDDVTCNVFFVRSSFGVTVDEGENDFIFWGQEFESKRSVGAGGKITLYNLEGTRSKMGEGNFNSEGIAELDLKSNVDVAIVEYSGNVALVPISLRYLNLTYGYYGSSFDPDRREARYFVFTDRPLYRPGDTVYFKAVLRNEQDVKYSIPTGNAKVTIYTYHNQKEVVFEKSLPISPDGTIHGEYTLSPDVRVGYYTLEVELPGRSDSYYWAYGQRFAYFDVEHFRKPEYTIDVEPPVDEIIIGDDLKFTISGEYFWGFPLAYQEVEYRVTASSFYEYTNAEDFLNFSDNLFDSYWYGYWYGSTLAEGTAELDSLGRKVVEIKTKDFDTTGSQVLTVEVSMTDESGNPTYARKNILMHGGEYGIYRSDRTYGYEIDEQIDLPVVLLENEKGANVSGVELMAKVQRTTWVRYKESGEKYDSYRKETESLPNINVKTDPEGKATFSFVPEENGSYELDVRGRDSMGNKISKEFRLYVWEKDYPYFNGIDNEELSFQTDKEEYLPSETMTVRINSNIPNRDVLLLIERGTVHRYQVVELYGKSGSVDIPLRESDIPNVFVKVQSFSDMALESTGEDIEVSAEGKRLSVTVTPDSYEYGPGETAAVAIETLDSKGRPVSADVALWAVDKSIFELTADGLGDIFEAFWSRVYSRAASSDSLVGITAYAGGAGGGCFARGTKVLMADGGEKNVEDVVIGDIILTRAAEDDTTLVSAEVTGTHGAIEPGYLVINGSLRVTANHIVWVNGGWEEAGSIQRGDVLADSDGKRVSVETIEWVRGKFPVYNLIVAKYHTYFADGVWVHNQKGGGRSVFEDVAYWNPSVKTDENGIARVRFELPDNLTTWVISAVASTKSTKVGQTTEDIVVSKDIVMRPILPNILREGDEITLAGIVHNFTESDRNFDVDLEFEGAEVEEEDFNSIKIDAGDMQQFRWNVVPGEPDDQAELTFSALVSGDENSGDTVTQKIPVREFGFEEYRGDVGNEPGTFEVDLHEDSDPERSSVTLSVSPTIVGSLPDAMEYLIQYPYGCVEQTTSRLVPAVIAKENPDLFGSVLKDKDLNEIIEDGISLLIRRQNNDGGWSWWGGESDPFVTAYVVEYLVRAKKLGFPVEKYVTDEAKDYLARDSYYDGNLGEDVEYGGEDLAAKMYGLTMLGAKNRVSPILDFDDFTNDVLALAVISNYSNGYTDSNTNGLDVLESRAESLGSEVYWKTGGEINFGSDDASTALALRAILLAGGDRTLASGAARYLIEMRKNVYWSNTFATAQVLAGLVAYANVDNETAPNYEYTVSLDGEVLRLGKITNRTDIVEIEIPVDDIDDDGSDLTVEKDGSGNIYTTLSIKEFRTDTEAGPVSNGLSVERTYVNEKGANYSIGVGDTVIVELAVSGLTTEARYGVIQDELPAGLVPINGSLDNERDMDDNYWSGYYSSHMDITENGAVISLYRVSSGEETYSYKARAVSGGEFITPPAVASLMYAPEVYGRSAVETVKVDPESIYMPLPDVEDVIDEVTGTVLKREKLGDSVMLGFLVMFSAVIVVGGGASAYYAWKKGVTVEDVKVFMKTKLPTVPGRVKDQMGTFWMKVTGVVGGVWGKERTDSDGKRDKGSDAGETESEVSSEEILEKDVSVSAGSTGDKDTSNKPKQMKQAGMEIEIDSVKEDSKASDASIKETGDSTSASVNFIDLGNADEAPGSEKTSKPQKEDKGGEKEKAKKDTKKEKPTKKAAKKSKKTKKKKKSTTRKSKSKKKSTSNKKSKSTSAKTTKKKKKKE